MNQSASPLLRSAGRCAGKLAALSGWRRRLLAVGLGALATASLPPVHFLPLLLVAFPGLVWLIDGCSRRVSAFAVGWWFGLGHFVTGTYWIALALFTQPERFAWLAPFAVVGVAALLAVFTGLATVAVFLSGMRGVGRVVVLALAWTAAEWLRGHVLSGFPWNLIGTAFTVSDAMIQLAALTGVWGLSLLTVLCASMPAVVADGAQERWLVRRPFAPLILAALVLALTWAGGALRLEMAGDAAAGAMVPGVRLRLVQPNITQGHKWKPELRKAHFERHLRLTMESAAKDAALPPRGKPKGAFRWTAEGTAKETPVTHVIWPETAVPYYLGYDLRARVRIARVVPKNGPASEPGGGLVITGAPRRSSPGSGPLRIWNSVFAIDRWGEVAGSYDKFHLVPFGEYVPLRRLLSIAKITHGGRDFSAGPGPRTLHLPGLPPVSPLICYEAIFPGRVLDPGDRPRWLLNVTNDGWFGLSSGPYQHFASARLRSVEEGLPLVRAANTGISGVTDAYGRVLGRLGLGREGVLDSPLPEALAGGTPYSRFGDGIIFSLLAVGIFLLGGIRLWRARR